MTSNIAPKHHRVVNGVWTTQNIEGRGEIPPPSLGQFKGPLLIMGGARCVWDDLKAYDEKHRGDRMAVNDIGAYYHGEIQHWVSLHCNYMLGWYRFRTGHGYGGGAFVHRHSDREFEGITQVWDIANVGGTSGLFACKVALLLGYDKIVLAGIPMDNSGNFFDAPWYRSVLENRPEEIVWLQARDTIFEDRVRSLSGKTRAWLGEPSEEWLNDNIKHENR